MPFEIRRERRGAYKRFSGFVTNGELFQSVFEIQSDSDCDRMAYTINDFLAVTGYNMGAKDLDMVTAYVLGAEYINARIRFAVVTGDPQIRDMIGGVLALTHYRYEFFYSVEDARRWVASSEDP